MTKKSIFNFVALAILLLGSVAAFAQNLGSTRGNLGGTVYDATKAVVPDAKVTITGPLGSQTQMSTAQGTFMFTGLVPGTYSVKVEKSGFRVTQISKIDVLINNTATYNVTLEAGAVETTVEVSSSAASVDTTTSSVNSNLNDTFYDSIPVARNVSAVIMLAPGVVSGLGTSSMASTNGGSGSDANPSISGSSGLENLYVADGVVLNDPSYGGFGAFSTSYGALGVGITPAFVKEIEVKTAAFEPQYGHSTGGVVQIVTKSGGQQFHGTIGAVLSPQFMSGTFLNKDDFNPTNYTGRHIQNADYEGDFELGGYVPGPLKNHLFFFGALNPSYFHNYVNPAITSNLYLLDRNVDRRTNTTSYAGKITYQASNRFEFEGSVFGDPAHTNHSPWFSLAAANATGFSKWDYGTRNTDGRIQATLTPTWTASLAYTYAWNHFTETPALNNVYPIRDQTQTAGLTGPDGRVQAGQYDLLGLEFEENYKSQTQGISFDTQKVFRAAGNHTISFGYFWQNPRYDAITTYSGPRYSIPATNASGFTNAGTTSGAGQMSDAFLELRIAPSSCTLCPLMDVPGYSITGNTSTYVPVVLFQARGRFDGGVGPTWGKYHSAYLNDSWQMGTHVTLDVGLRWEQQSLNGKGGKAFFNDQWSPRIGFVVDPTGDRKSKIYTQYSRLAYILPLDLSVRELNSEKDNLNEYWAPASDANNLVTFDQYGAPQFVPDSAHLLNNATGGIPKSVSISIQAGGEPFTPGIRMEYNDEFVIGAEHQFNGGFFASARYIDRRMKRVVEDEVGQSVEQLTALAYNGGSYSYVLGNPSSKQQIYVTPNEITWMPADPNNPNADAPAGCFDANNVITPYTSGTMEDTFGNVVGAACFPAVNGLLNTDPNALFGGEYFPNGCKYCHPGLYPDPQRNYQAVEFEVNKSFSNNWQMRANFRVAKLRGNYEGAFRNDNGQSDPGISSLYDLTNGDLGLLGSQLGIGPLNTDRTYVLNIFPSYTIAGGFAKGLTLGTGVNIESGVPLTSLAAQEIYGNAGEVPIHGRGDLGRSPVTGTVSAHLEYPINLGESKQLKLGFDAFNIANTRRSVLSTQAVDLGFQVKNQDYYNHIPLTFVAPFSAQMSVAFTF
jgi:Carboxypeptidase regulatory-like domain